MTERNDQSHVLEHRYRIDGVILPTLVRFLPLVGVSDVPRELRDRVVAEVLGYSYKYHLTRQRQQRDQTQKGGQGGQLAKFPRVRFGLSEEKCEIDYEGYIDEEELEVRQVGVEVIEERDREKFREGVGYHELEDAEAGDEGGAALADEPRDAHDVGLATGERGRHAALQLGQ